ncbi:MAG: AI-2E family transporter [Bacteroidia bacterium]
MFSNNRSKIILAITILCIIAFVVLFTKIVIYMLIATIMALVAQPFVKILSKITFSGKHLPNGIIALISLVSMLTLLLSFFYVFVPLIVDQAKLISGLNFNDVFSDVLNQFPTLKRLLLHLGTEQEISQNIYKQFISFLNIDSAGAIMNDFLSALGSIIGGFLTISFITFFLLKDDKLAYRTVLLMTPTAYEEEMKDILRTTKSMLSKYFVSMFIDVIVIMTLVSSALAICGVPNALFIGVFAGVMNVIPYVGPLISFSFACFLGITGCMEAHQLEMINSVISKIFWVYIGVNMLDGFIIQPWLYSNSVKAHPLEIFIVILLAASLAGVWGMIVAIPTYTLFRIVAKEFLANYKFFKKMTENIPE